MGNMLIKPKEGLLVRDPKTMRRVPPDGIEVNEFDPYWNRRVIAGDVLRTAAPVDSGKKE